METVAHAFRPEDLVGGHLALDFANTVNGRGDSPEDWLEDYSTLLDWAALTGQLPGGLPARLRAMARREPREAKGALGRARRLREAVFSIFESLAGGTRPPAAARDRLEKDWKRAIRACRLGSFRGGRVALVEPGRAGLDAIRLEVALRAVRLLEETPSRRLRLCSGANCGWLFLDTSRGGRRRWCDMATCGNVAKAQGYAARRRGLG